MKYRTRRRRTFHTRKRRTVRRSFRRRPRRARRTTRVRVNHVRGINYIADRAIVRFKVEQDINVQQGDANYGVSTLYPGNWLPTEEIPTLGEWVGLYTYARVLKSTISATFTNIDVNLSKDVGVTQLQAGASSGAVPSATAFLSEQPRTRSKYLTPVNGSKCLATIRMTGNMATAYGDRTVSTAQKDILGTSALTSPPPLPWRWNVWTQDNLGFGTAEPLGTNIRVIIFYTVEFLTRVQTTD